MPRASQSPAWLLAIALLAFGDSKELSAQSDERQATCDDTSVVLHTGLSSHGADILRIAEIRGRTSSPALRPLRRGSYEAATTVCGMELPGLRPMTGAPPEYTPSWRLIPAQVRSIVNSAYPVDRANGALRGSKGASIGVSAGFAVRYGPLTVQVAPVVGYETNGDFQILDTVFSNRSVFSHPWLGDRIDWPQRFGEDSFKIVDAGESYARVDVGPVGAGVSNEILTWGTARRYPILLGDAAPGFPHVFLGNRSPLDVWIGKLDVQFFSGALRESEYFNEDASDDGRRISGVFAGFSPRGMKGLTLGVAGLIQVDVELEQSLLDLLSSPLQLSANNEGNGIFSFFFRWAMEEAGFELYAEWARDDAPQDIEDFLGEIDHASAWTAGFQKTADVPAGVLRVGFEMTDIKNRDTAVHGRADLSFFTHRGVPTQGHTHEGQLLGAWTGPGSDAQFLEIDLFRERTRWGVFMERVRRDDDTFEDRFAFDYAFRGHDIEFVGGVRASAARGAWLVDAVASVSHRKNRSFIGLDGRNFDFLRENNFFLDVTLSWWPSSKSGWTSF
ncbi:MAG: hypothetical protein IH968_13670 [Gemmatimonadetes bacterium]|nr:hypothetical protein [Gemmatimonadota bacterium]